MKKHVLLFVTEEKIFFITKIERSEMEYKSLVFPSTEDIENIEDSIRWNRPVIVVVDNKLTGKLKEEIIYRTNKLIGAHDIYLRICILGGTTTKIPGVIWVEDMEHVRNLIEHL